LLRARAPREEFGAVSGALGRYSRRYRRSVGGVDPPSAAHWRFQQMEGPRLVSKGVRPASEGPEGGRGARGHRNGPRGLRANAIDAWTIPSSLATPENRLLEPYPAGKGNLSVRDVFALFVIVRQSPQVFIAQPCRLRRNSMNLYQLGFEVLVF